MYSNDNDKSKGCWILMFDGHEEFWNNIRIKAELKYRGVVLLKTQTKLLRKYKTFHDHVKAHFKKEHPTWEVKCKICNKNFSEIIKQDEEQNEISV